MRPKRAVIENYRGITPLELHLDSQLTAPVAGRPGAVLRLPKDPA